MANAMTIGIHHIGLAVSDLEESVQFFIDALDWSLKGRNEEYPAAFVTDGTITVTLWKIPGENEYVPFDRKKNVGLHHLAFAVIDHQTLLNVFERVKNYPGVLIEFEPQPMGNNSPRHHFICSMPGGVRIEFAMKTAPQLVQG